MPNHFIRARDALLLLICSAPLILSAGASATTPVDVRVIDSSGETLVEQRQYTGGVKLKTDPAAECFGPGNGGSGDRVRVPGATALGAVVDAARHDADAKPISVTDAFGFGLGICGFGGDQSGATSYWYLKHNRVGAQVGGDQLELSRRDQIVFWHDLDSSDFPQEAVELFLEAPATAEPGTPFEVQVTEFDDGGAASPAAGVSVVAGGSSAVTGGAGTAILTLPAGLEEITAERGGDIPANVEAICVGDGCDPVGEIIGGSRRSERIRDTKRDDSIDAHRGNDVVVLRGGSDEVRCGAGNDLVIRKGGDGPDLIAEDCERVRRR